MPWKEKSVMSLRLEFVLMAEKEGVNVRELCRRYRISPKTGYKWLARYAEEGPQGLCDHSRRPHGSPRRTGAAMEKLVLQERKKNPAWGGRKIEARLRALGHEGVPVPSTITRILQRHGKIDPLESQKHGPYNRFEADAPNDLWQMDFKGDFAMARGRCHPLTIVDDHSRYSVGLDACANEQEATVRACLTGVFRRYGLPERMLMDNGSCWATCPGSRFTALTAWLIRLGICISHGRPYHPQTQGKNERFNRTLKTELLAQRIFHDLEDCQRHFDQWRLSYNTERPHEALGMAVPLSRYRPSRVPFLEELPVIEYGAQDQVRKVAMRGFIAFEARRFHVGKAFAGERVALRPTAEDGVFDVFYCHQKILTITLHETERQA